MKQILLIRHGATAGNLERRYIGRTDEPLCQLGQEQARALLEQGFSADRLYVSPAIRTVQTAQIAFHGMPYVPVPELWETDFGAFEGKTADELSNDPAYHAWLDANCQTPVPGGEAIEDFKQRCCRAFQQIAQQLPEDSTTAFVIHGGCIMAILEAFAVPKKDFYAYHIDNGGVVHCIWQGGTLRIFPKE